MIKWLVILAALLMHGNAAFAQASDPCQRAARVNLPISQTASTLLVPPGLPGQRTYICSFAIIIDSTAQSISLVEGTGATCAGGGNMMAIVGGLTAANGFNLAANGGFVLGSGSGTVAITSPTPTGGGPNAVCLLQSGAGRVAGNIVYVQQ